MAQYINYGGQIVMPPPFKLIDSMMYGFFFEADKARLQHLLNERVNSLSHQSNRRYTAFSGDIMALFATTPKAVSLDPAGAKMGYTIEDELVVWVLTLEHIKVGNTWKPNRLLWFIPYIFVNNILTIVAGREIYGIPKTLGTFDIPKQPKDATFFRASTSGFKTFSPDSVFQEYPLFVVQSKTADKAFSAVKQVWNNGVEALLSLKDMIIPNTGLLGDIKFCLNEMKDLLAARLPSFMLKEFRGMRNEACYQGLIEAPYQINAFHGGGLLPHTYELFLTRMASFPLTDDLGIQSGQTAKSAFWLNVDFTLELGKEIWKSPGA